MYRICGISSFVMLYYYLYKLKTNGPGKFLFGAGKSFMFSFLYEPWKEDNIDLSLTSFFLQPAAGWNICT